MIRYLNTGDIETLQQFERDIFSYDEYSIETLRNFILKNNDKCICLGYEVDNELVSYIFVNWFENSADLLKIATKSEFRNKGFAKELFYKTLEILKKYEVTNIFLEVATINENALNFYKSLGFEILRERKNYYKNGDNAFDMVLKIV